ncbi:Asp-tRNA(Asn)/Glu-tRNA(Gln) amidotransferase subunit GatA [Ignisphaera sp. 4213-co]|uniref:Glutamyl-tRNA(Gln) amidotransferase subunit A n=1 Tax=Ignisphaera cupida TaxID=3050454 RepID=A0ABD4Z9B5_9CREN|nr:Asp-tRNA(Asn)/Glu-tRNA(Gln) amidotransferase subunit GatA [Ignisphaera sp. 4213-co]MDK6029490.1 Asp-tRNA(Asn)/Glu-tRNA(Gln) amidotransferase subunit GatA [Ignisphaera sp. 4213-co]
MKLGKPVNIPVYKLVHEFRSDPSKVFEYIDSVYEVIKKVEDKIKSFITITPIETVYNYVDNLIKSNKHRIDRLKLFGVPIAIKDNISTKGIRTTCASKMLENYVPPYNATVIEKIMNEGGVIIGKTNMDEFAMGSTTETSAFYPTKNPWDLTKVPGGSSGGSATAIASGEAPLALGSDTGGSIRNPASFCGVYGLKPTYGLVSRYGLIAYASSMDQIGPMARNVTDLAMLLNVIAGYDPRDSTSVPIKQGVDYVDELYKLYYKEPKLRIGIIKEFFDGSEEPVRKAALKAVDVLCSHHKCSDISLPFPRQIIASYYIIAMAEASSNLARFDGVRYGIKINLDNKSWDEAFAEVRTRGFGYEVKKRIAVGAYILSAGYRDMYYIRALKFRRLLKEKFDQIFKSFDVVVSPTMPILPPKLGEFFEDPIRIYLADVNTVVANLIGSPAISIPIDFYNGLPIGLQAIAKQFSEPILLYIAKQLEDRTGFKDIIASV